MYISYVHIIIIMHTVSTRCRLHVHTYMHSVCTYVHMAYLDIVFMCALQYIQTGAFNMYGSPTCTMHISGVRIGATGVSLDAPLFSTA